ncbi:MAG: membrane dipeptidase, partial [Nitrospirota bacterium]
MGTLDTLNTFLTVGLYGLPPFGHGRLQHNVGGGIDEPPHYDIVGNLVDPAPELPFDGWPAHDVLTAQQMYYRWLERAWRGGERLMVMLAVNNQTLCQATFHLRAFGCEDMPAIERQVQAAKDLEAFIDAKSGGPGQGWFRIVYSGAHARRVISEGKLAVVLGIEAPSLLGCKKDGDCTEQQVRDGVQHLYDIGVRHVFPVHNADNAFGGTALYNEVFDANNAVITGKFWDLAGCPEDLGMEFRVGWRDTAHDLGSAAAIASTYWTGPFNAAALYALSEFGLPPRGPTGPHCNARGLTPLGEVLVDELMNHHMLIDVDHSSTLTTNAILDRAETANYPGIVSGHTGILSVSNGENRHEGQKTDEQIDRIRDLGGLVGVILHQGGHNRIVQYNRSDGSVPFVCNDSSDAWLQAYLYVVDRMNGGAVAVGSDFNGFAGMPAPRADPVFCGGEVGQFPLVSYPFDGFGGSGPQFDRQQIGERVIDYNYEGMASVGQLPDFIEEVRQLLPHDDDLNALFNSAGAYVRMWEKAEDETPPVVSCSPVPSGWQLDNFSVVCRANDWPSGLTQLSEGNFTLSTAVEPGVVDSAAQTSSRIVCDRQGNCTTVGPFVAMIDRRADLVVTSVSNPPAAVAVGSSFVVTDTVLNQSGSPAGTSVTQYYLVPVCPAICLVERFLLTGGRAVPSLAPGVPSTGAVSVTIPATMTLRTYRLQACADDTFAVAESNEDNNCVYAGRTISIAHAVAVDARALAVATFGLDALGTATFATSTVQSFQLAPGSYGFCTTICGAPGFGFTVTPAGLVDYAPALDGVLSGRGTATLTVNGAAIGIDARALAVATFGLDALGTATFATSTVQSFQLAPGSYGFCTTIC